LLLTDEYKCNNAWRQQLETPLLQNIDLGECHLQCICNEIRAVVCVIGSECIYQSHFGFTISDLSATLSNVIRVRVSINDSVNVCKVL